MKEKTSRWLKEGKQSKVTSAIKKICSRFKGNDFEKLFQALNWIDSNIVSEKDRKKVLSIFASRTADELFKDKNDTGCHDTALLLVTFLRALNVPAKYVLGIDKVSPTRGGHVVVEAYIAKEWILIDPSYFQLNLIPSRSPFYKNNYVVKKGLDSWDCGVRTVKDWHKISDNLIKKRIFIKNRV